MKNKSPLLLPLLIFGLLTISSCEKDENESKISSYNGTQSHNAGQNCMSCHVSGGSGEGLFVVAGTVYDSLGTSIYPNATVKLYTGPNGTGNLKGTLQVDGLGNFYTTSGIDFSSGLYPSVSGATGTKHMGFAISSGQCNSCHGVSTGKLWTK